MTFKPLKYFTLILLLATACQSLDEEKLAALTAAEQLSIQLNWSTCCAGFVTIQYELVRNNSERYLIKYAGQESEEKIKFKKDKDPLLAAFLNSCLASHDPNRDHSEPCSNNEAKTYEVSTGNTQLVFKPDTKSHELFNALTTADIKNEK